LLNQKIPQFIFVITLLLMLINNIQLCEDTDQ